MIFDAQIDGPWTALHTELQRQMDVYNAEVGQTDVFLKSRDTNRIQIESRRGHTVTLSLNYEERRLEEQHDPPIAPTGRRMSFSDTEDETPDFLFADDVTLGFGDGIVEEKAFRILRSLLDQPLGSDS